ncbi:MAG: hypothetical protein AB7K52_00665 [Phycisphaerales bacterium]
MPDESKETQTPAPPTLLERVDPASLTKDTARQVIQELGSLKVDDAVAAMGQWWPQLDKSARAAFVQWRWDGKDGPQRTRACLLLASRIHAIDADRAHSLLEFTYAKEQKSASRAKALREMWLTKRPKRSGLAISDVDARLLPRSLASLLLDDLLEAVRDLQANPENESLRHTIGDWAAGLLPTLGDNARASAEAKLTKLGGNKATSPLPQTPGAADDTQTTAAQPTPRDATLPENSPEARQRAQPIHPSADHSQRNTTSAPAATTGTKAGPPPSPEVLLAEARKSSTAAAALIAQVEAALADRTKASEHSRREEKAERERLTNLLANAERNAAERVAELSGQLEAARTSRDDLRLQFETLEAQLARTVSELEQSRSEVQSVRGELAKERELRLEAVAKERQETQRRMREQLSQSLQPEFAKLKGGTSDGDASALAIKLLGTIRQRLNAQGIEA